AGYCQCSINNVKISQSATKRLVRKVPEWNVTITNNCACSQLDVKLDCNGFKTVEKVDPSIMTMSGAECLIVNNGNPLHPHDTVSFTYASATSFPFTPVSSQIACS
ncbi:hypothetical protein CFOL_v3_04075, partial [Cephalotus follicularis]